MSTKYPIIQCPVCQHACGNQVDYERLETLSCQYCGYEKPTPTMCEKCGATLEIGCFPFCPHEAYGGTAIGDDIPGGQVIETLDHEPMTFYSKKAILRAADARGLRLMDKWAGPQDKYLTNWAAGVTAKTLDDARVLLSRGSPTADDPRATLETATFTVREVKHVG